MLNKLLEHLDLEGTRPSTDGVYHISFDGDVEVTCTENSRFIRFESLIILVPQDDRTKEHLLQKLLTRSTRMTRYRAEGIFIDDLGASIKLQRHVFPVKGRISEVANELREFLCCLESWREYVEIRDAPIYSSLSAFSGVRP